MKDKFTFTDLEFVKGKWPSKFMSTGNDFEGTFTIYENHGRLRSMANPTTVLQLKALRKCPEILGLEITSKSIFSTAYDSLVQLFDIPTTSRGKSRKKAVFNPISAGGGGWMESNPTDFSLAITTNINWLTPNFADF